MRIGMLSTSATLALVWAFYDYPVIESTLIRNGQVVHEVWVIAAVCLVIAGILRYLFADNR